jgi:hypothetical protein
MLRNLFQLLAPPSDHAIYGRRTRARVLHYWHQGAPNVLPASLPTTSSEITRKIRPEQPEDPMVVPVDIVAKANWPLDKLPDGH